MMRRFVAFLAVLAAGTSSLLAANFGTFHFGKVKFEPVDAFAYQADSADPKKPLTIVVLTSFKIDRPAVLAAINTPGAFVMQSADKGSFVLVRLLAPDKCGVSGFLGPTQQDIGVGDNHPAKTTVSTPRAWPANAGRASPGKCSTMRMTSISRTTCR